MSSALYVGLVLGFAVLGVPAGLVLVRLVRWLAPWDADAPSPFGQFDEDQTARIVRQHDRRAA